MITPGQLRTVFKFCQNPGVWVRTFDAVVDEFDLRPDNRLMMLAGQMLREALLGMTQLQRLQQQAASSGSYRSRNGFAGPAAARPRPGLQSGALRRAP